jgi:hypothetical protein
MKGTDRLGSPLGFGLSVREHIIRSLRLGPEDDRQRGGKESVSRKYNHDAAAMTKE